MRRCAFLTEGLGLAPREAVVRGYLAEVLADLGETEKARALVEKPSDVYAKEPRWWAIRALLVPAESELAFAVALGLAPLDPPIACKSLQGKDSPADPGAKKLCDAARRKPRE